MPLKVTTHHKQMTWSLEGDDLASIEEIKKKLDEFALNVSESDKVLVTVYLAINPEPSAEKVLDNAQQQLVDLLMAFKRHFKTMGAVAKEVGTSRTTLYNWMDGQPPSSTWISPLPQHQQFTSLYPVGYTGSLITVPPLMQW